uniref:Chitinase domain containing 1 n=1 Tax=Sinocyclocheilus rhinocerous TaxID=307959 RepID=A0A673IBJ4_9TELE
MRADLTFLHVCLLLPVVRGTLSKTDARKASKIQEATVADHPVQDRGLLVTDPQWWDIVREEKRFCPQCVSTWNSHGYDIAKLFGPKLTSVSPVWLQLRRRGPESFHITGLHDHDPESVTDCDFAPQAEGFGVMESTRRKQEKVSKSVCWYC